VRRRQTLPRMRRREPEATFSDTKGHVDSNAGGQIILETNTKEKNVPASRKGSSTLTSTSSSVNDASTSSRCRAPAVISSASTPVYDQDAAVDSCVSMVIVPARLNGLNGLSAVKRFIWSEMLGVHSLLSRQVEYQCTAPSSARFFLCGRHFGREEDCGARIQHGERCCSVSGG